MEVVTLSKAERFFRELSTLPISVFTTQKGDFEKMKKLSRDLLKEWAENRRKEIIYNEIMSGQIKQRFSKSKKSPTLQMQRETTITIEEDDISFSHIENECDLKNEEVKQENTNPANNRVIRRNVYSQITNTGITHRDQMRRKLVMILREGIP